MNRQELKSILLDLLSNYTTFKTVGYLRSKSRIFLLNHLVTSTNYMEVADISERIYHIIHDLYEKPKCKLCDVPIKSFMSLAKGYGIYCSKICRNKDTETIKHKVEQTCLERYGTTNVSFTKNVKDKISISNKGRQRNEEFKNKMSEIMKGNTRMLGKTLTKEHVKKLSDSKKGKPSWNKGIPHTEETKQKISAAAKNRVFSVETRQKMSKSGIQRLLKNGSGTWKYIKKGKFYSDKNKKEIGYDSSYELAAYNILEQLSKVLSYDRCPYSIDYNFNGEVCRYLPDILVSYTDGSKEIIEVKPRYMVKDAKVQAKKLSAEDYCNANNITYSFWTEKELNIQKVLISDVSSVELSTLL